MGFVRWTRKIGEQQARYEAEYRTNVDPNGAGFRTSIEMNDEQPLRITVEGLNGDKAFELRVNKDLSTDLFFASVRFRSLGELDMVGTDFKINKRPVLPQSDPV